MTETKTKISANDKSPVRNSVGNVKNNYIKFIITFEFWDKVVNKNSFTQSSSDVFKSFFDEIIATYLVKN